MTKGRWLGLGLGIAFILAAFGIVTLQALSLFGSGVAQAQAVPTPTVTTVSATPVSTPTAKVSDIGDTFWGAFAAKLGLDVDDVKAKALETRKEMLDQAVKDGRTTQAQADALKQKLDANGLIAPIFLGGHERSGSGAPPFHGVFPGFHGWGGTFGLEELEAVAKVLKLAPSDLVTKLRTKSLADIAKAQGVDEAAVKQAIVDAGKAQIDRQAQDGLLTQAQADELTSRLASQNIDLSHSPFFFRFGLH